MESWILALPFLLIFLLIVVFILVFFKKWMWAIVILLIVLSINGYGEVFAFRVFENLCLDVAEDDIKVLTFNIHGPGENFDERIDGIVELVKKESPDIVFLSESYAPYKHYEMRLDSTLIVQLPYSTYQSQSQWENVFYSKYPIDTTEVVSITAGKRLPLIKVDVNGKKLHVLGCHLSSNNYVDPKTKMEVDSVANKGDAKLYLKTIESGYLQRRQDVDSIIEQLSNIDKYHLIVAGDLNDIGGSYTLRRLESIGLQDAWWNGGFGLGGTREVLSFPFRIDHILYGFGFELKNVNVIESGDLSDHDAVVARARIK